jgi:hypothetical protein
MPMRLMRNIGFSPMGMRPFCCRLAFETGKGREQA